MIGHHTHLRENDDLPLWQKAAIFNVRALITGGNMRSKDAQCNSEFNLKFYILMTSLNLKQ